MLAQPRQRPRGIVDLHRDRAIFIPVDRRIQLALPRRQRQQRRTDLGLRLRVERRPLEPLDQRRRRILPREPLATAVRPESSRGTMDHRPHRRSRSLGNAP